MTLVGIIDPGARNDELLIPVDGVRYVLIDPDAAMQAEAARVDALFTWDYTSSFLADNFHRFERLRWIHASAAGVDRVLFPALVESDVVLTNSRHIFDRAMGEYTLGLMLALAKDFATTFRRQQDKVWSSRETDMLLGKTLLSVGVGPIAREVARRAKAFGMTVRGVGRAARDDDPDFGSIAGPDGLSRLLPAADYVVVIVPLTPQTAGLIDAEMLALLKPSARVLVLGRGATVDQQALRSALAEGRIAGAALDVFGKEPLPADDPLWGLPNVIVSPHMSGDYHGWRSDVVALFLDNLQRWLRGDQMLNVVDKKLGYVAS